MMLEERTMANKYAGTQTEKNLEAAFAGGIPGPQQIHVFRLQGEKGRL